MVCTLTVHSFVVRAVPSPKPYGFDPLVPVTSVRDTAVMYKGILGSHNTSLVNVWDWFVQFSANLLSMPRVGPSMD